MNSDDRYDDFKSSSNNTSISHTMDLIKAAVPYLGNETKESLDLIIKVGDLIELMGTATQSKKGLSALSIDINSIDIEGLLTSVRHVCYEKERAIVDMILNFIKAKNMYQTYTTLTQVMASQNGDSTDTNNPFGNMGDMASMFGNMGNMGDMANMFSNMGNMGDMANMFSGKSKDGESPTNMNEMLEAFLTPEQISTYETLSVLLNAM